MGFRTVVMLSNDQANEWESDPKLGEKISRAMNMVGETRDGRAAADFGYGRVVECTHADTQTLAVVDLYFGFKPIGYGVRHGHVTEEEIALRLLKQAAEQMGYRLVKKSKEESK